MRKIVVTMMWMLSAAVMLAQSVSIEQCQRWARERYPLMKRYDLLRQTETFTLENVSKGWLPQVGVSAQATYQSAVPEYPEMLSEMLRQMGSEMEGISPFQYKAAVDVQQMIYDGGSIKAGKRVAAASSKVQEASTDVQMYALRERVNDLCFGILLLGQRLRLNEEMQRTIDANRKRLQTMLEGGVAMQCDVDALSAELAVARQQHTDVEARREAFVKVLSLFTGQEIREITPPTVQMSNPGVRLELSLFDQRLSLVDAKERALETSLLPRVGLFGKGYYGYLGMNMFRDMTERTPTLNGVVGIKVSWNLSAFYTHKNDRRKLSLERETIGNDRETFLFNQRLQEEQEDGNVGRYRRLIREDDAICRLRRNVREATEAKLEAGIIDVNALVQEVSRENQAQINKAIHETELLRHQYKLQTIKGE